MKEPEQSRPEPPAQPERAGSGSVLYIEDHPDDLFLIKEIIEAHRPEVTLVTAAQGNIGLELAKEYQPALILLNMNLPDMSGLEVFQSLRNFLETKYLPVVTVSANILESDIKKALALGIKEYLTKPISIAKLLQTLDRFLDPPPKSL
jgi:CheY-like chemotaxis protein